MSSIFSITAPNNNINIEKQSRQKNVPFTVTNTTGIDLRGRASLATAPNNAPHLAWLAMDGESERPFVIGATEQYRVTINVPADATPGNYTFRLNMVATHNPDETFSEGPTVTIAVPAPEKAQGKFPIWIIPAVLGVLAVVAVAIFLLTRSSNIAVPDVIGLSEADGGSEIEKVGLGIGRIRDENSPQEVGRIARTDPSAGASIAKNGRVDLFISKGTAIPEATPIPTETPTATPDLTGTASVQATQTADAQILAAIAKYTGTWVASDTNQGGLTKLEISNSGPNMTLRFYGKYYSIKASGGLASLACPISIDSPSDECEWAAGSFVYTGDPLNLSLPANGLDHVLTISITSDGTTLSIVDQEKMNGSTALTQSYVMKPSFRVFPDRIKFFDSQIFEVQPAFALPTVAP